MWVRFETKLLDWRSSSLQFFYRSEKNNQKPWDPKRTNHRVFDYLNPRNREFRKTGFLLLQLFLLDHKAGDGAKS